MTVVHKSSKKGFTLLEMMLSIAIVTIVSGCLVTLMIGVKDSYINTYNSDDSTDYAMLFAKGFENSFLGTVQDCNGHPATNATWKVGTYTGLDGQTHQDLLMNGTPLLKLSQMKVQQKGTNTIVDKWKISMTYEYVMASGMVKYTITVVDNYYDPGVVKCVYNGGFFLPHFDNGTIDSHDGTYITFRAS